jgi:ABC-2 type transport system ATP-binding protein
MRMILGLDRPTSGSTTVNGVAYGSLADPLREAGSMLDARAVHGGRTAHHHCRPNRG